MPGTTQMPAITSANSPATPSEISRPARTSGRDDRADDLDQGGGGSDGRAFPCTHNRTNLRIMSYWGKLLGGLAGFAVGGPFGAMVGAALGHAADGGEMPRLSFADTPFNPARLAAVLGRKD